MVGTRDGMVGNDVCREGERSSSSSKRRTICMGFLLG